MPNANEVHIDAALTNLSVGYRNPAFIADLVAPVVPVRKQSDKYFIHDAAREVFRQSDDRRAPGAEANEVNFALSSDNYYAEDHALTSVIPDEERENADPVIQPAIDRTEFLRAKIDLNNNSTAINMKMKMINWIQKPTIFLSDSKAETSKLNRLKLFCLI